MLMKISYNSGELAGMGSIAQLYHRKKRRKWLPFSTKKRDNVYFFSEKYYFVLYATRMAHSLKGYGSEVFGGDHFAWVFCEKDM
jgi:hypothetical protein